MLLRVAAVLAVWLALALPILRAFVPTHVFSTRALLVVAVVAALEFAALVAGLAFAIGGPPRRVLGRAALGVGAGALLLLVLEAPVGLFGFDWRTVLTRQDEAFFGRIKPWKNPWNVPDPALVFRRPPNAHVQGRACGDCVPWLGIARAQEYEYDLQYDGRGYRNEKTLDAARIVVLGDSFVEAAFVPADSVFTTRLGKQLGVDVANLGVGGYGPQQELEVLRRDGLPLAPRLVFWCFFEGNDLNDARRFEKEGREENVLKLDFWTRSFTTNASMLLARAVATPLAADGPEARKSCGRLRVAGPDDGRTVYFPYPAHPLGPDDQRGFQLVTGILDQAAADCRKHAADLIVVFVPEKFRVYRDLCGFAPDSYPTHWEPSDLPQRLEEWGRAAGVKVVDLTESLHREAAQSGLVYFADDGHWNARGHAVAAEALVAESLLRRVVEAQR